MVISLNIISVVIFIAVVAGVFFLRWEILFLYKFSTKDLVATVRALVEKGHQQQVIYNISTSIFLLHSASEIIKSTISEVVVMYHWSNVAFFPYGEKEPKKDFYGQPPRFSTEDAAEILNQQSEARLNSGRLGEYTSTFLVGGTDSPLGLLYVAKAGSPLTADQVDFFKTIANFLTLALSNIALKS